MKATKCNPEIGLMMKDCEAGSKLILPTSRYREPDGKEQWQASHERPSLLKSTTVRTENNINIF
jgi:hypothetical protein